MLLSTIETAFNTIFRVIRHRPLWSRLVVYMVLLSLGPIVLGASMSLANNVWAVVPWAGLDGQSALAGAVVTASLSE